jgi:hypothetical protein
MRAVLCPTLTNASPADAIGGGRPCAEERAARGGVPVVRRDAASGGGASRLLQRARWLAVQIPFCSLHVAARVKPVLHGGDCTRNGVN